MEKKKEKEKEKKKKGEEEEGEEGEGRKEEEKNEEQEGQEEMMDPINANAAQEAIAGIYKFRFSFLLLLSFIYSYLSFWRI